MEENECKKPRRHYSWVILGLTFSNLFVEGGVRNSRPVFLPALREGFGGSAAMTSAIFSVSGVVSGFTTPILGKLLDKIGPKYMFPIAGLFILLGFWASSMVNHMWQIFIFYSIIATLGDTSVSSFSATTVLSPWFPKTKGVMLGIADAGNPAGQAVITPLAQFTIINYGWRVGFQVLGSIFFLIVAPLNFLLQRRPPNYINNLSSQEETVSISKNPDITQCYAQSAQDSDSYMIEKGQFHPMKEPAVWYLVLSRATGSISHQMTNLHIIAFFVSSGYGQMQTATALGIAGLFGIIARPSFGILSDRIGREVVFTLGMGMSFLSILLVILFTDNASLLTLIIFVTLTGFSDGLSGLILGAKTADLYHPNVLGSVTGIVDIGRGIGIATGGIFTGLLFDKYGDYTLAYSIAATLLLISITAIWIVRLVEPKQLPA